MTPNDEKLSPNFTWGEMTRTGRAGMQDLNREEAEAYKPALRATAQMLQKVRDHFGPLKVNSCFRGPSVNQAVGGSKGSQHLIGEAVDFVPASPDVSFDAVIRWIALESGIPFGQLIDEKPGASHWIHLSLGEPFRKKNNRQVLTFDGKEYKPLALK